MNRHGLIIAREQSKTRARHIAEALAQGVYLRLARGVYVDREKFDDAPPWEKHRLQALAVGFSGPRVIGGRSAAQLWGMWTMLHRPEPVEYFLLPGRKDTLKPGKRLRGYLRQTEWIQGEMCKVTSIPRTLFDLARFHSFEECFMAASWVLANDACPMAELKKAARRSETLQRVLDLADPYVESAAEACFLAQVRKENLIDVQTQVSVVDARETTRRPDFQIRKTRILIEISGLGKYGETEDDQRFNVQRATDRLDALATAGYRIWAYSAKQVFSGFAYRDVLERYRGLSEVPSVSEF